MTGSLSAVTSSTSMVSCQSTLQKPGCGVYKFQETIVPATHLHTEQAQYFAGNREILLAFSMGNIERLKTQFPTITTIEQSSSSTKLTITISYENESVQTHTFTASGDQSLRTALDNHRIRCIESIRTKAMNLTPFLPQSNERLLVATLLYLAPHNQLIPPYLLRGCVDSLARNQVGYKQVNLQEKQVAHSSWFPVTFPSLPSLTRFKFWQKSDPKVVQDPEVSFNHGGGREFIEAFVQGTHPGYADQFHGKGIFITPKNDFPEKAERAPRYALRTPISWFQTPCVIEGTVPSCFTHRVNHNADERVIAPEGAKKIKELTITNLSPSIPKYVQEALGNLTGGQVSIEDGQTTISFDHIVENLTSLSRSEKDALNTVIQRVLKTAGMPFA